MFSLLNCIIVLVFTSTTKHLWIIFLFESNIKYIFYNLSFSNKEKLHKLIWSQKIVEHFSIEHIFLRNCIECNWEQHEGLKVFLFVIGINYTIIQLMISSDLLTPNVKWSVYLCLRWMFCVEFDQFQIKISWEKKKLIAITININDGMISQWLISFTLLFQQENHLISQSLIVYIAILHQFTNNKTNYQKIP